jgi:membrane-bound serine protease (ClpP class)
MTAMVIAMLIVVGFLFLILEIFIVPGFSVPGLAGMAMIGYGIFRARVEYGTPGILIAITASAVAAIILVKLALKSRTIKAIGLDYNIKEAKAVDDYSSLVGKEGTALTTLRPSGMAMIEDKRFNVVTAGEYIETNSPIKVSAVEGTRIIVKQIEKSAGNT